MVEFPHDVPNPEPWSIIGRDRWRQLANLSGLPDEAHADVERAVHFYRISRKAQKDRLWKCDKFEKVKIALSRAREAICDFEGDTDAFWVLAFRSGLQDDVDGRAEWSRAVRALRNKLGHGLDWWRTSTAPINKIEMGRPRLRDDVYVLIRKLAFITHEYAGNMTSYSTKGTYREFLKEVCVNEGIKESMIRSVAEEIRSEDKQFQ
jgi:hypothetical protein